MPEISVVVPAYQAEKYLEICVESILAQTFKDFEVILVDDGSTDKTAELCHRLEVRDKRIKFLSHTRNRGLSAARNTGIMVAKGKYVAFVDSDDLILEDGFQSLYEAAERHAAEIVDTQSYLQTEADSRSIRDGVDYSIIRREDNEPLNGEELLLLDSQKRLQLYLQYGLYAMACNKLYRRDFLIRYGLLFPMVKTISEDFLFTCNCLFLAKRYLRVPREFYVYCGNPTSLTRKSKSERHLSLVLNSMIDGAAYLEHYLRNEPFFAEEPSRLEAVQQHWFEYCKLYHIAPKGYYQNGQFTREVDMAIKGVLRERFGAQAGFVTYMFHAMNAHHAAALALLEENEKLKAKE